MLGLSYKTCDAYFLESIWRIPAAQDGKSEWLQVCCLSLPKVMVREAAEWRWHIPRLYREYCFAPSGFPAKYLHGCLVDLPVMQRPLFTAVTVTVVTFPLLQPSLLQVTRIRDKMSCSYVSQSSFLVLICQFDWSSVHRMPSEHAYVFPWCLLRT